LKHLSPEIGVSILIPAHGDCPFLNYTLTSIRHMILDVPFEVLIVLDRASSSCLETIKDFQKYLPIKLIESRGEGISHALNTGLSSANYDYVARMDSDDEFAPTRIQEQYSVLSNSRVTSVVGSSIELIDPVGRFLELKTYPLNSDRLKKCMLFRNVLAHPAVMYKRDTVLSVGGYRTFCEPAEDYDLWLRILSQNPYAIRNLAEGLTRYRVHQNQISTTRTYDQVFMSKLLSYCFRKKLLVDYQNVDKIKADVGLRFRINVYLNFKIRVNPGNHPSLITILFFIIYSFLNPSEIVNFLKWKIRND
jgi:glycosyltransferase involved in cell wall biosynthesis